MNKAHLAPNSLNTLVIPETFIIDLYIDPADPRVQRDVYILLNEDGSEHQRRAVSDDVVPGDNKVTLVFTGLYKGLRYSLLVDEGPEGSYYAFYQVLLDELLQTDANPSGTIDSPGDQSEPKDHDSLAIENELPNITEELCEHESSGWEIADHPPTIGADDPIV